MIDYVAKEFLGTALARELSASLADKRVLLPRSERAGRDLPRCARKAGGRRLRKLWRIIPAGSARLNPESSTQCAKARVDVVSFFSPSAVENLRGELGADVLSRAGSERGARRRRSGNGSGLAAKPDCP